MAINKVKYGEYMISLLRCHTGRDQGEARRGRASASANDIGGGVAWGRAGGSVQAGQLW